MRIVVEDDAVAAGERAAGLVAELLGPGAVLGVATGSSPSSTYAALQRRVADGSLDPRGVAAFALDEYLGLAPEDPRSYAATIERTVTVPLRLDPLRVHVPSGSAADPDAEAAGYDEAIAAAGGVDVQILGIGSNGHLAFNEPGSALDSRTRVARLSDRTRRDNARFFASPDEVPTRCITQGLGTIQEAGRLVAIALGGGKAAAVERAVTGPVDPGCPASILQRHPDAVLVLDRAAASLLGPGTARR